MHHIGEHQALHYLTEGHIILVRSSVPSNESLVSIARSKPMHGPGVITWSYYIRECSSVTLARILRQQAAERKNDYGKVSVNVESSLSMNPGIYSLTPKGPKSDLNVEDSSGEGVEPFFWSSRDSISLEWAIVLILKSPPRASPVCFCVWFAETEVIGGLGGCLGACSR